MVDGARRRRAERSASAAFFWILALSAALKIGLALAFADLRPRYDETEYLEFGRRIVEDGASPVLWRAPMYQWFVAAGLRVGGGEPVGVRLLQAGISVLASLLAYHIARARWGERVAFAAGAFVALYPSDVSFSHLLWSETIYGALTLAAFDRLLAARERADSAGGGSADAREAGGSAGDGAAGRRRILFAAATAGLCLGLATLTRSTGAALFAVSIVWCAVAGRARLLRVAAVAIVWASVVGPWSASASARAGRFVLVDTNSGFNLWSGNNALIPRDLGSLWCVALPLQNGAAPPGPLGSYLPGGNWRERVRLTMAQEGIEDPEGPRGDDWYRREAIKVMRASPQGVIARIPSKLAAFWAPDFFLPRHVLRDWYGPAPPALGAAVLVVTWAAAFVPLVLGPAALAILRAGAFRSLAIAWIGVIVAIHAIAYGHSRLHAPLVPILVIAVFAAWAEQPSRRRVLRRGLAWAVLALVITVASLPVVVGTYIAPGARHAALVRTLGAMRQTPLPGARWLAWMQSGVEESLGRFDEADRVLHDPRWEEDPWTIFLRARLALARAARDPQSPAPQDWEAALPGLRQAASLDPASDALAAALLHALGETGRSEEAAAHLERVQALRRTAGGAAP